MIKAIIDSFKFYFRVLWRLFPLLLSVFVPVAWLGERFPGLSTFWTLIFIIALPAVYFATYDCIDGRKRTFGQYVKLTFANYLWFHGSNIFFGLIVIPLLLLGILPGLIAWVYLQFTTDFVYREGVRDCVAVLKESWKLVKGHWWVTMWYDAVCLFLALIMYFGVGIAIECCLDIGEDDLPFWLNVGISVLFHLMTVFVVVAGRVWFVRLSKMREKKLTSL